MKFTLLSLMTFISFSLNAATFKINNNESKLTYVGKKVTGEHTGNLSFQSGSLEVDGGVIKGGEIVVDMNTLTSTDITDKDYNAKYVTHMKSEDFFNTPKYPQSKIIIKKSEKTKNGLKVSGDLTMLGVTKPVSFEVSDLKIQGNNLTGTTKMILDRTNWGLKYGSSSFFKGLGDKAIENNFTIEVKIAATSK